MDNLSIKIQIMEEIRAAEKIILVRHLRPDGDAIGSTKGFCAVLRAAFPQKTILVLNDDSAKYLKFMGGDDEQRDDAFYQDALIIVIDTGTESRISNKQYRLGKKIVKIDHHIDEKPFGDISWVEDFRSSACEMIVDFCDTFKAELPMTKEAATYLYTGMVTDTGRFRFDCVTGDTLRLAATLLDTGIETETLFANLYLKDAREIKYMANLSKRVRVTENGVAYLYISRLLQKRLCITLEEASNAVSCMESIKNNLIWLAFIETPDKQIRVRLRSRFATVQQLASRYHGGGHERASGATLSTKKEFRALLRDADKLSKEYKETHEGWQ